MLELRTFKLELRAEADTRTISGHAAVFNSLSESFGGWFREEIQPGAFRDSLAGGENVFMFWNHNSDIPLASTVARNLTLSEDDKGLAFRARLGTDTWSEFAFAKVQDGTVRSMSFGFQPVDTEWVTKNSEEVRILKRVNLLEVSPVMFPAYKAASVSARSVESIWREREKQLAEAARAAGAADLGVLMALNEHRRRNYHR